MTFEDFGLDPDLLEGIAAMGYKTSTPIQEQAIPLILKGKDLIACAQTGTGKTAAFVLPVLHKIITTEIRHINTLILAPTRELAIQIDQQIEAMAYYIDVSSIAVYGGNDGISWEQQKRALQKGADIIIATPGRLIALIKMKAIDFSQLRHFILDEADRMLDMGFIEDIERIVAELPEDRQTLLFSATMPPKIRSLSTKILRQPAQISLSISKPAAGITQIAYMAYDAQKDALLRHILSEDNFQSIIIFASTKEKVKQISHTLQKKGIEAKAFHSDLKQEEREAIMQQFKNQNIQVLIGTDVLSRGIDVSGIDLVINYDVPPDPEDYIHRIGRTARAEKMGTAITFINPADIRRFVFIERLIESEVPKKALPEGFEPAPEYIVPDKKRQAAGAGAMGKKKKFHKPKPR